MPRGAILASPSQGLFIRLLYYWLVFLFGQAASLITDIASVYVIAASGVVAAFMGFNAYSISQIRNKYEHGR